LAEIFLKRGEPSKIASHDESEGSLQGSTSVGSSQQDPIPIVDSKDLPPSSAGSSTVEIDSDVSSTDLVFQ